MTALAEQAAPSRRPASLPRELFAWLGSMKLAVCLLLLLAVLTWLGTLAQVERSTYDVQREYFESWGLIADLPLSWWGHEWFTLKVPLPGALPVMGLLFANLILGGMLRMKWRLRNAGILITHVGIALLLVAGVVKLFGSFSGSLALYEQPTEGNSLPDRVYESNRFVSFHDYELALLRDDGDSLQERVVPESALWAARDGTVTLQPAGLPFTLLIHHWIDNARALPKGPMVQTTAPVVDGAYLAPLPARAGEQPKSENEWAGCNVTVLPTQGERIEAILWGVPRVPMDKHRYPFTFTVEGKRYGLDLRHVVFDLPFAMRLKKFQKQDHPGTLSPRDFRSFVEAVDGGAATEAQIFMNNPLRRDGYVVYQSSWGPQVNGVPKGAPPFFSVFEVSYNPSDVWPKLACYVIAFGLLWHFGAKLRGFLKSTARTSLRT